MIDWLEDVLRAAESEAEQERLLNLIAQMAGAIRTFPEARRIREKADDILTEEQENSPLRTEPSADTKEGLREERIGWKKQSAVEDPPEQGKNSDLIRDISGMGRARRSLDGGTASYSDGFAADPGQSEREVWKLPEDVAMDSRLLFGRRENPEGGVLTERVWQAMEQTLPGEARRGGVASSALSSLYRRTAEAIQMTQRGERNAEPVTVREERTAEAGITVRELDRAVRRDSRRYDGGMNIY